MKHCQHCKHVIADDALFCSTCGRSTEVGSPLVATARSDADRPMRELMETRSAGISGTLWRELRTMRMGVLFPLRAWLRDRPWSLRWVRWFTFFGFFPLGVLWYFADDGIGLRAASWLLGIYFALIWALVFRFCLLPEPMPAKLLAKTCVFNWILCGTLIAVAHLVPFIARMYEKADSAMSFWPRLAGQTVGVGLVEEVVKALPVFLFLYRRRLGYRPLTYAFVGVISGLAFGVYEAVDYCADRANVHFATLAAAFTDSDARDAINSVLRSPAGPERTETVLAILDGAGYGSMLLFWVLRLFNIPLGHALYTGLVAYFMGVAVRHQRAAHALMLIGLAMAAAFHGLGNSLPVGWATASDAVALVLFVAYMRSDGYVSEHVCKPAPVAAGAELAAPVDRLAPRPNA